MLKCNNITKEFHGNTILKGISLEVIPGEIFCLLGKNASGKSTLVKIISGILEKNSGEILINGENPRYPDVFDILSVLFENPAFYPHLTLRDNLEYFARILGNHEKFPLDQLNLSSHLDEKVKNLSRGTVQKLGLMLILWKKAKVYILDEPLAHLDPQARDFFKNKLISLKRYGKSVLMTTHIREDLNICSRVAVLENGKIGNIGKSHDRFVEEFFREISD